MTTPIWHCHVAMSLDGKIARSDHTFDWLESYPPQEFGIAAFEASIDAVVMGRTTYEIERRRADWPHAGKPTFVVTSRALIDPPSLVEGRPADLLALAREMEQRGYRKVGVEGGGQLIRGLIAAGKLDVLEMALIPLVLGDGIPLFPPGTQESKLRLASCEAKPSGALHLIYKRA